MSDALIEQLAAQIRHHRARYYNDEPEISDAEFDALEDRLRALAPDHPVLGEVGAPPPELPRDTEAEAAALALVAQETPSHLSELLLTEAQNAYAGLPSDAARYKALWLALQREAPNHRTLSLVPPPRGADWPKATHELPMGSLNKVNTPDELREWAQRCDQLAKNAGLASISEALALTEKLDGISLEVVYEAGVLEAAITRGDGVVGERITANVAQMKGVPSRLAHLGRISARGEVILRRSDATAFEAWKKKADPRFTELKSLRNTAAGIARTKDAKLLPGCRFLTVLFYDLEGVEGLTTEKAKLDFLSAQGFGCPEFFFGGLEAVLAEYQRYQDKARDLADYEMDGLVIRADAQAALVALGDLNHRPRAAIAFKFGNDMGVTTLESILWSTGDSGRITPIAQVQPVFLAGAEIRQASLHNLANVKNLQIGIGDQVLISRRNDVIPYVEKVVVKGPNLELGPEKCGVCETPVAVDGEYLLCPNELCPARRLGRLRTWIKHLGLLEWGEKTFIRLYEAGLVREVPDLYRLKAEDITQLEGYGELSAKKLLEPLQGQKQIPITTFIAGLGIPQVSKETAKLLARAGYVTFDGLLAASADHLAAIEGLGKIKAEKILSGVRARLDDIQKLAELGVLPTRPDEGGPLAGLSFCFSGSSTRPRKVLEGLVEKNGGNVASGVNKGLTYLVLADPESTSTKAQKARKLGTEIISEESFVALIQEKGGQAA